MRKLKLILSEIWDRYLIKVQGDKHWHFELCFGGFYFLMLADIIFNLWWWVAITIAEVFAIGKEIYDRYWGREKKFDLWEDLQEQDQCK